jgi:hypothetical protein
VITNEEGAEDKERPKTEEDLDEVIDLFLENDSLLADQGETDILNQLKNMNEQELFAFISNFDEADK